MDRGAWLAWVHGVAQSWTQHKQHTQVRKARTHTFGQVILLSRTQEMMKDVTR